MKLNLAEYPLTYKALIVAVLAAVLVGLIADSLLVGFAIFVLVAGVGCTWLRDQPIVFPFIIAYQWVAITVGYFYSLATGVFPSVYEPGDIELTLWLSLGGLLLLAVGIRVACSVGPVLFGRGPEEQDDLAPFNLSKLFLLVIALYAVDYVHVVNARAYSGAGNMLARVLDFRQVLLLALWFEVLRRRTDFIYLWFSLAWVFVPLLGAYFSDFKTPLILLFIVYASSWRPWEAHAWRFKPRDVAIAVALVGTLAFGALLWQAGVKVETRKAYDAEISRDPIDRVRLFVQSSTANLPVVFNDTQIVVEGLVERISYITFFSRVLDHVPKVQPHANGELLRMATVNAVMPRFLFPDKPELPSDSVYTRRFTGIRVPEEGTSISIGYMAEFYADWGVTGMLVMVFVYGCWIGLAYRVLCRWIRPRWFLNPVLITTMMAVYQFEHQFIKTFATLNLSVIVMLVLVSTLRVPLATFLDLRPSAELDEASPEPTTT